MVQSPSHQRVHLYALHIVAAEGPPHAAYSEKIQAVLRRLDQEMRARLAKKTDEGKEIDQLSVDAGSDSSNQDQMSTSSQMSSMQDEDEGAELRAEIDERQASRSPDPLAVSAALSAPVRSRSPVSARLFAHWAPSMRALSPIKKETFDHYFTTPPSNPAVPPNPWANEQHQWAKTPSKPHVVGTDRRMPQNPWQ